MLTSDSDRAAHIRLGVKDSLSVGLGIFPLGVGLGFLVIQTGLPWWVAPALSIGVFAGSVEYILVGMLASVTPLLTIAVTVFAVNFRHVFYAFSFPVHLTKPGLSRAYSIYAMIDEAFATAVMVPPSKQNAARLISMQLACQIYWVFGSLVGVGIASLVPTTIQGFEFALVALFTVMTIDSFRSKREIPAALLAGVSIAFSLLLTPETVVLTSLIIFFVLLTIRFLLFDAAADGGDEDES